jgi:eukaryotic-like serine/threonine-protein kinase
MPGLPLSLRGRPEFIFILRARARSAQADSFLTNPSHPHFSGNKDIMQFWNELEGRTIDGVYPLRRLVRSEGRHAWFETETAEPEAGPATISLTEAATDADEVLERLQAAQQLKHPNLVTITKVGQVRVDTTLVIYAVMEHIEQSLSDVLQTQVLSPEEGREVAEALVSSLTLIHQKGMSHGRVEASSVLATEETVKLRSDCLHTNAAGQADDVAAIGSTLFHAFTQRKELTATDAQINRIPAPFAEIIRNSFGRRWTLAQISNALKPVLPVASVPPRPAAPAPVASTPRPVAPSPAPVAAKTPVSTPPPVDRPAAPEVPARYAPRFDEDEGPVKRKPWLLYGGLGVILLAIIGWLLLRPHPVQAPVESPNPPAQATAPAPAPPAQTSPAAPSGKPSAARSANAKPGPSAKASAARPAAAIVPTDGRTVWRVVAYTYRGQSKASDMVTKISGKHSDLGAEVYSPPGRGTVYLVTVGGAMDHDAAVKMRDRAQREGLPADTYVQNFSK